MGSSNAKNEYKLIYHKLNAYSRVFQKPGNYDYKEVGKIEKGT